MTRIQKIRSVLAGILMILFAMSFAIDAKGAYRVITLILSLMLLIYGIRMLVFYFRMARHMVGGRSMLYRAVIILDLGIFTVTLSQVPMMYVMMYLVAIHAFSGVIDILRSAEARSLEAGSWKLNLAHGVINVAMAALCVCFMHSEQTFVLIYSLGLCYSGLMRIVQAFRKSEIVYVQ